MKTLPLQKIKSFLLSTVVGATTILFLSPSSEAANLRFSDDGRVIGIEGLNVEDETYNVEFVEGSYDEVFADSAPLRFGEEDFASFAAAAIVEALGDTSFTRQVPGFKGDQFFLPARPGSRSDHLISLFDNAVLGVDEIREGFQSTSWAPKYPWAVLSSAAPLDQDQAKSTPEPNLILGFITLGGVMLGSRKKEKA